MPKDDIRIETNGQIDHLNALLGIVRTHCDDALLRRVQQQLMVLMSHVATPQGEENPRPLQVDDLTAEMEQAIDRMAAQKPAGFVIPGDRPATVILHLARTQCRTVERRLWTLHRHYPLPTSVMMMMNRLSDYLFTLAL